MVLSILLQKGVRKAPVRPIKVLTSKQLDKGFRYFSPGKNILLKVLLLYFCTRYTFSFGVFLRLTIRFTAYSMFLFFLFVFSMTV